MILWVLSGAGFCFFFSWKGRSVGLKCVTRVGDRKYEDKWRGVRVGAKIDILWHLVGILVLKE